MLYTSPFELLDLPAADLQQMDRRMLLLKKKQLLAELELADGNSLALKNKEFTKNDIITLFDQLENGGQMEYHAAIAADPVLLQFLQTGQLRTGQRFSFSPLWQDESFLAFVSPYYKAVFNQHVLKALAAGNYEFIGAVFKNPVLLHGPDYDECYGKLHGYLQERLTKADELKQHFSNDRWTNISELHSFYIYDWISSLNNLPEDFSSFREDYCIVLYNFSVDLWNGKKKDEAMSMLYGLQSLDSGVKMKGMVNEAIEKLSGAQEAATSSDGPSTGRVIWFIVVFIIAVIRIANSCNRSSNNRYNYSEIPQFRIEDYQRQVSRDFPPGNYPVTGTREKDNVVLAMLETLYQSDTGNPKKGSPVKLKTGDDPYKAFFNKSVFTQRAEDAKIEMAEVTQQERLPMMVEDEPTTVAEKIPAESDAPKVVREDAPSGPGQSAKGDRNFKTTMQLKNETAAEVILFFINNKKSFSVYLAPKSTYRVPLGVANYHLMAYAGKRFATGLPMVYNERISYDYRRYLVGMGRFSEVSGGIMRYLQPANAVSFSVFSDKEGKFSPAYEASLVVNCKTESCLELNTGNSVSVLASAWR